MVAESGIQEILGKDKKALSYADLRETEEVGEGIKDHPLRTCIELCPEYIDYLRKLLNKYLD